MEQLIVGNQKEKNCKNSEAASEFAGNLNILLEWTKIHIPLRIAGWFEQISSQFFEPSTQTAYFRINYTLSALCMAKRIFTGFRGKK